MIYIIDVRDLPVMSNCSNYGEMSDLINMIELFFTWADHVRSIYLSYSSTEIP